ncbi:MAG: CBS domain-containing protein [Motiliproteus sp.]
MALVIYDAGIRIQTPASSLLNRGGVEALTELGRSRDLPSSKNRAQDLPTAGDRAALQPRISREQQNYSNKAKQAYQTTQKLNRRTQDTQSKPSVVSQIMTSPVFTVPIGATVEQAYQQFLSHHVRHLAVVNGNGRCHGMISDYDLFKRSSPLSQAGPIRTNLSIEGTYSKQLIAATPDTSIQQVAVTFLKRRLTCLPVINESGQLQGIVTHSDLVHLVANEAGRERWA